MTSSPHLPEMDGPWIQENDAERIYVNLKTFPHRRVSIHFHHAKDTFRNPKLLKNLLDATGWTETDLRRLKLVK